MVSLPQVWELPPDVTIAAVGEAFDELERRHEALRTRYETTGERGLIQAVWPAQGVRIETIELTGDVMEQANRISHDLTRIPLELEREQPMQVRVITTGGVPVLVSLCILHLAADGSALSQLRTELLDLLAGRELQPAPSCLELAAEQRSQKWSARNKAAIDYWRRLVSEAPPVSADGARPGTDTTRWAVTLHSADTLLAATALAEHASVPISSVVLAAYGQTIAERSGRDDHLIGLVAGNRLEQTWQNLVTSMDQLAPMLFRRVAGEDFVDTLRRIHWQTMIAYKHGIADVDEIDRVAGPYGRSSAGGGFRNLYNFLADLPRAIFNEQDLRENATERQIDVSSSKRNNGFPFYLNAHAGDVMVLYQQESSTAADATATIEFVQALETRLESAAGALPTPVG